MLQSERNMLGLDEKEAAAATIVPSKKKLPEVLASMGDDMDKGNTLQHRYQRLTSHAAALTYQQRVRQETGLSYPTTVPQSGVLPGTRLRCAYHPGHLPPCYLRALPFAKYCPKHILKDPNQLLYKQCSARVGVYNFVSSSSHSSPVHTPLTNKPSPPPHRPTTSSATSRSCAMRGRRCATSTSSCQALPATRASLRTSWRRCR